MNNLKKLCSVLMFKYLPLVPSLATTFVSSVCFKGFLNFIVFADLVSTDVYYSFRIFI